MEKLLLADYDWLADRFSFHPAPDIRRNQMHQKCVVLAAFALLFWPATNAQCQIADAVAVITQPTTTWYTGSINSTVNVQVTTYHRVDVESADMLQHYTFHATLRYGVVPNLSTITNYFFAVDTDGNGFGSSSSAQEGASVGVVILDGVRYYTARGSTQITDAPQGFFVDNSNYTPADIVFATYGEG